MHRWISIGRRNAAATERIDPLEANSSALGCRLLGFGIFQSDHHDIKSPEMSQRNISCHGLRKGGKTSGDRDRTDDLRAMNSTGVFISSCHKKVYTCQMET